MSKIQLEPGPFVLPMPLAMVGAEVDGKPNFMPAAFVGIANYKPPVVACGLSPDHHTCDGIVANGAFSLNLPGPELVEATDWCGIRSGKKVDKSGVFDDAPMLEYLNSVVEEFGGVAQRRYVAACTDTNSGAYVTFNESNPDIARTAASSSSIPGAFPY